MKANIKIAITKLRAVGVLALLRNVIAKMTGNPNFPTPPVTLAAATTLADDFEAAIEDATNGSKAAKAKRNDLEAQCADLLRQYADYQRMLSNGDVVKLSTGGFELEKKREHIGIPGVAQKMEARFTNAKGELELRWRSVHGAHGYQVWMTDKDPGVEANWTAIGYTTRVRHLVGDLESYKAFWFCVSAIGVAGEGLQSDPAMGRAA